MSIKEPLDRYGIYIPLTLFVIFTFLALARGGSDNWAQVVLTNALTYALGCQLISAGYMHIFRGNFVAEYIGWPKNSPFQYEVGLAGLGMGVIGVMCSWYEGEFQLAVIVVTTIFLWGAAIGHVHQMVKAQNFHPGNAGYMFYWDVFMPPALIVLYWLAHNGS